MVPPSCYIAIGVPRKAAFSPLHSVSSFNGFQHYHEQIPFKAKESPSSCSIRLSPLPPYQAKRDDDIEWQSQRGKWQNGIHTHSSSPYSGR